MRNLTIFTLAFVFANSVFAASWKYQSVKCSTEKMTQMLTKKPNEEHYINIMPDKNLVEFRSVYRGESSRSERFFYQYAKKSPSVVEMQKVDVTLSTSRANVSSFEVNSKVKPFRYKMTFDIDSLVVESKLNDDGIIVTCNTTYKLNN